MAVQFTNAVISKDNKTGVHHCKLTVTGGTAATAEGVGDTPEQAKRHAVATYRKAYPKDFMDIPT